MRMSPIRPVGRTAPWWTAWTIARQGDVAALERKGFRRNTLIIFHSDNGGTRDAMFAGQMANVSKIKIPCDNGPYRGGKGQLFEGGCRVAAFANWPGRIKPRRWMASFTPWTSIPTLAALAGASIAKCKPLDGVNVWDTIAEGKPSPRTEVIYNIEPFRGAVRQGDWKLIWRTLVPTSVDLYNLGEDPYEQSNVAADHPDKVAAMQERINALGKIAKPLLSVRGWRGPEARQAHHRVRRWPAASPHQRRRTLDH